MGVFKKVSEIDVNPQMNKTITITQSVDTNMHGQQIIVSVKRSLKAALYRVHSLNTKV